MSINRGMRQPSRQRYLIRSAILILVAAVCELVVSASAGWAQVPFRRTTLQAKVDSLIAEVTDHEDELEVVLRRSKLVRTKHDVYRIAIADEGILEVVQFSPREIEIIGRATGTTTLTFWFGDERRQVLSYLVTVVHDDSTASQARLEFGELEKRVNELFPNSKVQLIPVADKLIVRGQARDAEEASQIMAIIRGEAIDQGGDLVGFGTTGAFIAQGVAAEPFPDASDLPSHNVISLLEVPGEMQVMLKVRIAELKRSALRRLGANIAIDDEDGDFFLESVLTGSANILAIFDEGEVTSMIDAFTSNNVMKILAEPNLVTLSGRTASFIAGGEFAVPTVVGVGGVEAATTQFRGFGTQLTFTPTVIDKDRIRLEVAPEFSAINDDNTVGGIPGLDTRAAFTTVDLREGQWLAIAGLLEDQQSGSNSRVPLLGDIPVVGAALSSKSYSRDETELIVLVSPELVHPMEPEEVPALLPGTDVTEPDDVDFYLHGRLEGCPDCHHRSTVWPLYRDRMHWGDCCAGYEEREGYYVVGDHGFSR